MNGCKVGKYTVEIQIQSQTMKKKHGAYPTTII
jgi:hypothetical protein